MIQNQRETCHNETGQNSCRENQKGGHSKHWLKILIEFVFTLLIIKQKKSNIDG